MGKTIRKTKNKGCSSCRWFVKHKATNYGGGICEMNGCFANSDTKKKCLDWKPKKYKRG